MEQRRIAVFTASRAEYGLLRPVLMELEQAPAIDLQLIVAAGHLASSQGRTVEAIEDDGFQIASRIVSLLDDDSSVGTSITLALTIQGVARTLDELAPDLIVVLGDRYETLGAATAAMMARIPIAHIHGGETTEGAIDEAIRHSITKMSHLHLVAAEPFHRRVLQLGEDPASVHVVGAPGLDNIRNLELLDRAALTDAVGWDLSAPYVLVTHHPATLDPGGADREVQELLEALSNRTTHRTLLTAPNSDPDSSAVRRRMEAAVSQAPEQFHFVASLGQLRYLSAMQHADAVVGNSSSGLIEAPFLGTATVNIGERQRGRPRASSVIDCPADAAAIARAIDQALALEPRAGVSPYGDGRTAPRVAEVLANANLRGLIRKRFHDRGH